HGEAVRVPRIGIAWPLVRGAQGTERPAADESCPVGYRSAGLRRQLGHCESLHGAAAFTCLNRASVRPGGSAANVAGRIRSVKQERRRLTCTATRRTAVRHAPWCRAPKRAGYFFLSFKSS